MLGIWGLRAPPSPPTSALATTLAGPAIYRLQLPGNFRKGACSVCTPGNSRGLLFRNTKGGGCRARCLGGASASLLPLEVEAWLPTLQLRPLPHGRSARRPSRLGRGLGLRPPRRQVESPCTTHIRQPLLHRKLPGSYKREVGMGEVCLAAEGPTTEESGFSCRWWTRKWPGCRKRRYQGVFHGTLPLPVVITT